MDWDGYMAYKREVYQRYHEAIYEVDGWMIAVDAHGKEEKYFTTERPELDGDGDFIIMPVLKRHTIGTRHIDQDDQRPFVRNYCVDNGDTLYVRKDLIERVMSMPIVMADDKIDIDDLNAVFEEEEDDE